MRTNYLRLVLKYACINIIVALDLIAVGEQSGEAIRVFTDTKLKAENGDARFQGYLGSLYENGRGVAKDDNEAVRWYRKAADQGYAIAQTGLGMCYLQGKGSAKDSVEAVRWLRKAADQGDAYAQYNLGVMYDNGTGVPQD